MSVYFVKYKDVFPLMYNHKNTSDLKYCFLEEF